MPESIDKLRATLAELEAELGNVETLDPASRQRLEEIAAEISAVLRRNEAREEEIPLEPPHNLQERMLDTVETFEVQYPTIAGVLQRLVNGLAQLGI
jgi:hypothetical protein